MNHPDMIAAMGQQVDAMRRRRAAGAGSSGFAALPGLELRPDSLAGYELLGERHRGGQGVVYEAIQRSTKRRVAVKVLYESAHSDGAGRRRFEREIEILTQIRHPNIVTVHDSGQAATRFYYIMDLVTGVQLDRWIESQAARRVQQAVREGSRAALRNEIHDTLVLFQKICDAVNAAHLRGVIHRDLKPGNILIDDAGEPHVLDFGLAKYTLDQHGGLADVSEITQSGHFVGSVPWASPEQTNCETDQIDTRTDVYSLGVLLYQALAGQFPYNVNASVTVVLENIRTEAPRPINRARLGARPAGSSQGIDDELETIVLKCLQKDRERRYQTAGDLGRDLQRYLRREPIEAKRDSLAYVLRTQLRRYRVPVAIVAAFVLLLVIGLVTSVALWRRAGAERDRAKLAETASDRNRRDAETVTGWLEGLLASANPSKRRDANTTALSLLDDFQTELNALSPGNPVVESRIRDVMGRAFLNFGQLDNAERELKRAVELRRDSLGSSHVDTARSRLWLAYLYRDQARYPEARELFETALGHLESQVTPESEEALHAKCGLAEILIRTGEYDKAAPLIEQAMQDAENGGNDALRSQLLHCRSMLARETKGAVAAEPAIREEIEAKLRVYGPDHVDIAISQIDLADSLIAQRREGEAERELQASLAALDKAYQGDNPRIPPALDRLASLNRKRGELEAAERLSRRALEMRRRLYRDPQRETVSNLSNLGTIVFDAGRPEEALGLFQEALNMLNAVAPDGDAEIGIVHNNVGRTLYQLKRYDEAEQALHEALTANRRFRGENDPKVLNDLLGLTLALKQQGRFGEAIEACRELIEARRRITPDDADELRDDEKRLAELEERRSQPTREALES